MVISDAKKTGLRIQYVGGGSERGRMITEDSGIKWNLTCRKRMVVQSTAGDLPKS